MSGWMVGPLVSGFQTIDCRAVAHTLDLTLQSHSPNLKHEESYFTRTLNPKFETN